MPTLVLSPRYSSDSRILQASATKAGWSVERLGPDRLYEKDIVLSGESLFVEVIASHLGLALIDVPVDWLPGLEEKYLKRKMELTTLEKAQNITRPVFVKPADRRKGFEGRVYQSGKELPEGDLWPGNTQVLVVEPVDWEIEFRCFLLERKIITISPYLKDGEITRTEEGEGASMAPSNFEKLLFCFALIDQDNHT